MLCHPELVSGSFNLIKDAETIRRGEQHDAHRKSNIIVTLSEVEV